MIIEVSDTKYKQTQLWLITNEPVAAVLEIKGDGIADNTFSSIKYVADLLKLYPANKSFKMDAKPATYNDIVKFVCIHYTNNTERWIEPTNE